MTVRQQRSTDGPEGLARVSVIVPTFNRPAALARCLEALARQSLLRSEYEVIVIDDGSEPSAHEIVQRVEPDLNVMFLRQANQGPAAARNLAVTYAQGRFLAFTDDDCRPEPKWLETLLSHLETAPGLIVGGKVRNGLKDDLYAEFSQLIVDFVYEHNLDDRNAFVLASNNLAMSRDTFDAVGGFDPAFRAAEDRDLCDRLQLRGHKLRFDPSALVLHEHHLGFLAYLKLYFRYGRGAFRFHQLRIARRPGHFARTVRFHSRFRTFLKYLTLRSGELSSSQVAILLMAWQAGTLAGFCWEGLVSSCANARSWLPAPLRPSAS